MTEFVGANHDTQRSARSVKSVNLLFFILFFFSLVHNFRMNSIGFSFGGVMCK